MLDDEGNVSFPDFVNLVGDTVKKNEDALKKKMREERNMNGRQLKRTMTAFSMHDKDKDGKIASKDLKAAIKDINPKITPAEIKDLIKDLPTDEEGMVSIDDFVKVTGEMMKSEDEKRADQMASELGLT